LALATAAGPPSPAGCRFQVGASPLFVLFDHAMRKHLVALIGLAAAGTAALIYRNWRHIVRHLLRLSPATYAVGVQRNIPIEVEHGLTLAADHYYPTTADRFPTILIRSPYGRELRGGPIGLIYGFMLRRPAAGRRSNRPPRSRTPFSLDLAYCVCIETR
jgi:hypothetical protein